MCLIYCSASSAMLIHPGQNLAHSRMYLKSGDIFDTFGCKSSLKMKDEVYVLLLIHHEFILRTGFIALHRPLREFALF